ncbi:hypothetical protein QFZ63_006892 [Streptomyces sp. B3I7]|nr:hypothetical protein [Streptomyces sp. B3I7]
MQTVSSMPTSSRLARRTSVCWISRPVQSPAKAVRRYLCAPKQRCEMRPSPSRAKGMPKRSRSSMPNAAPWVTVSAVGCSGRVPAGPGEARGGPRVTTSTSRTGRVSRNAP